MYRRAFILSHSKSLLLFRGGTDCHAHQILMNSFKRFTKLLEF